jgi:prephenate dehydratase
MIKLAYLGPDGSNSFEAMKEYIKKEAKIDYQMHPCTTIESAISAVVEDEADEAIVPLENSVEGSVNVTLDMLASHSPLLVVGELVLPIAYQLLASPISKKGNTQTIASHPQAIAQCRHYLRQNYPDAKIIPTHSTSEAAKLCKESEGEILAIANASAGELFLLKTLDHDIQDVANNSTRFVVLSKRDKLGHPTQKLSLMFSVEHKPGTLFEALEVFKICGLNLTKIESRPSKKNLGEYIFFVDILADKNDLGAQKALAMLHNKTIQHKILGFYSVF